MKKIFIFQRLNQVSYNYHSEGGLVIIADDKEDAIRLIADDKDIQITEKEWEKVCIYETTSEEKRYWVMPDAGCC